MIEPSRFYDALNDCGIDFFCGVPDSLLKSICAYIADHNTEKSHIIAANEGNAFAIGIGYHLATKKVPMIYMQNSGLGNIVNPLLSLADPEVYSIPSLLMIGWRGEPGVKDEPQHAKQGRVTLDMLKAMEIPFSIISSEMKPEKIVSILSSAVTEAKRNLGPFALVVKKGSFADYTLKKNTPPSYPLFREDAIKVLVDSMTENDIIVSTTGVTSRELFEYRETLNQNHEKDFLTVGGMGHASQIALGISLQKPSNRIYCFDGDGAALMHMGAMAINASLGCSNFTHIIFNNGAHDSVGGQPTVGHQIDFLSLAKSFGYTQALQAETSDEIKESLDILNNSDGASMLEIRVNKGFRKNLGRPTQSTIENKTELMKHLN